MKEIEFLFLALMCAVGSQDLVLSKLEGALGVTIGKSHLDNLQYTMPMPYLMCQGKCYSAITMNLGYFMMSLKGINDVVKGIK